MLFGVRYMGLVVRGVGGGSGCYFSRTTLMV